MTPAPFGRRLLTVTAREEIGPYVVVRAADPDGPAPLPGQFFMLAAATGWGAGADERPFLPRAFSALDAGLSFLLDDVGPGTHRLRELRPGDELWATGPLGRPFEEPANGRRAVLVAGGVGVPPIVFWSRALASATVLAGFRNAGFARAASLFDDVRVATDDGSEGHEGFVTDLLAAELDADEHAQVYACGPPGMLESVRAMCTDRGVPAQLALESGMACGFGACFGCVVPLAGGGYARVCVDGPVMAAAELAEVPAH